MEHCCQCFNGILPGISNVCTAKHYAHAYVHSVCTWKRYYISHMILTFKDHIQLGVQINLFALGVLFLMTLKNRKRTLLCHKIIRIFIARFLKI